MAFQAFPPRPPPGTEGGVLPTHLKANNFTSVHQPIYNTLPYVCIFNGDTITHTITFNSLGGDTANKVGPTPTIAAGTGFSMATLPWISMDCDSAGTPSNVDWWYSDVPWVGPRIAGGAGLAPSTFNNQAADETIGPNNQELMFGFGADATHPWTFTPTQTGIIKVTVKAWGNGFTNGQLEKLMIIKLRYASGAAPANGAAATGNVLDTLGENTSGTYGLTTISFAVRIKLTPNIAYWFDLSGLTTANDSITTQQIGTASILFEELAQ